MKKAASNSRNLRNLRKKEQKILKELDKVEKSEKKILREQRKIVKLEKSALKQLDASPIKIAKRHGLTSKEYKLLKSLYLKKLTRRKYIFNFLILTGVVLAHRGIWVLADETTILSHPLVSLASGIAVLIIIDQYKKINE